MHHRPPGGPLDPVATITQPATSASTTVSTSSSASTTVSIVPKPTNAPPNSTSKCGKWYVVKEGDTCESISKLNDIDIDDLYSLNPELNSKCDNLLLGLAYCVQPAGDVPTYSSTASVTETIVPKPTNAPPNSTSQCGKWYVVKEGDTCESISKLNDIDIDDLHFLNPELNSECDNLLLGLAYCVQPAGDISTYTNYPTTSHPYTLPPIHYTTTTSTFASAPPPSITPITHLPIAPGTVDNCKDYVDYVPIPNLAERAQAPDVSVLTDNINSCDFALSAYEVSMDDFLSWNPILANVTPCALQPGYSYCLINSTDECM